MKKQLLTVLIAEDDLDDRLLLKNAFEENARPLNLRFVSNGIELLAYLRSRDASFREENPRPAIIMLDLNMPGEDGRKALQIIKGDTELRSIPTLVFTGAFNEHEVHDAYHNGSNSFISKPQNYSDLVAIIKGIEQYWFDLVEIPARL